MIELALITINPWGSDKSIVLLGFYDTNATLVCPKSILPLYLMQNLCPACHVPHYMWADNIQMMPRG
jgi:hypothetical protein